VKYIRKMWRLFDNYIISRWQQHPSTAGFWYLPEPPNLHSEDSLTQYQQSLVSPLFFLNYQKKLEYNLKDESGIIVLPYDPPVGQQVNPEAAFQYALGLHDAYYEKQDVTYLKQFWHYVEYFLNKQTVEGLWEYAFDWFGSKAPWHSALAQTRGACVMLRAWMLSKDLTYLNAAKNALRKLCIPIEQGGFLHQFKPQNCPYFEEYPQTPTGVINGFMSSLICVWEMQFWLANEKWIKDLWEEGIKSLEKMLPYYNIGWWSLYDLDDQSPILNVNSPRYHLLEIHYLQILSLLSRSQIILDELNKRQIQYKHFFYKSRAFLTKLLRKLIYR
jgi:hypothetical protein